MSYAVIQTGGKQYKVKSGEILKIEKLADSKPDTKVEFKEILAYGDDKTIEIGAPTVEGAKVEADLIKFLQKMESYFLKQKKFLSQLKLKKQKK
jgi:large subunit ribosomal protein L21